MATTMFSTQRMCNKVLTLTAAALLATGVMSAQSTMPNSTTSGGNTTGGNSTANSGGSMNGGANGSMSSGMPMGQGSTSGDMGSMQDKKFAKTAIAGGLAEIQTSQLALQKSNSDDVKKFAQQMIDDHTKLNDQMTPIATQLGVTPPTAPMPHDQAIATKLQGLSGTEFDKAYIKAQVQDHMKDDKEFQKEASSGQNPQEKDAATQGDTIIKQHLQMAMDLQKAHSGSGSGSKSSM